MWTAAVAALVTALVACDGGGGDDGLSQTAPPAGVGSGGGAPGGVLASVSWSLDPSVRMDLVGLNRLGDQHVVAQIRLTNTAERATSPRGVPVFSGAMWDYIGDTADQTAGFLTGIGLVDSLARRLLMPYRTADNGCVCSQASDDSGTAWLAYDQPTSYYAVLPAPSGGATTTTVWSVMAPPMVDVPISDEPPVAAPGVQIANPDDQQATRVEYVIDTASEALDGSQETIDHGQRVEVHVSSDVLFEIDEADLSPRARAILQDVAAQIDASTGPTVTIEGHADSTGTDAINDPLSQRRADAVHASLAGLVTRPGIQYEVHGYGSHRPLYSNETEEGRRRNRRVTISFDKPAVVPPPSPATTPTPPAPSGTAADTATTERTIEGQPFVLEVTGLDAIGNGLGVLRYRVTNNGDRQAWDEALLRPAHLLPFSVFHVDAVSVVDTAQQVAYLPARIVDESRVECACTPAGGVWIGMNKFEAGQARDLYAIVQLPEGADAVTVRISEFPELANYPIAG